MYSAFKNKQVEASAHYRWLFNGLKQGKIELPYLEGTLQLANLSSRQGKKDTADYYFLKLREVLQNPLGNTAIGVNYIKLYRGHQLRFKTKEESLDPSLVAKDSLFKAELLAATKDLTYQHKIEKDRQKAAIEKLAFEKKRQGMAWIISSLLLLLLAGGIIIYLLYQKRKQSTKLHQTEVAHLKQIHKTDLIKKLSASQEAERWRIADQLHDEVGSMISVVRLNLAAHPLKKEAITPEKLETANRVLADVADTVREMSHQLMPVAIRQYGLIKAIEQLITDINTSGKIYIEQLIHGFEDVDKYPEDFQISFYRIIQELFQNIVKHSKATNAIFQLVEHPDSINLYIEDNGKGMDNQYDDKTSKGIGLLANRIDYFEGKISIEGSPGKGTLVVIDIPTAHLIEEHLKENNEP
jgi:signal transduction histidine kinase